MKPCIVSFSSMGRENYNAAMLRLISTTKESGFDCDFILHQFDGYVPDYKGVEINQGKSLNYPQPKRFFCPNHQEMPYMFKLAMIQLAREKGYEQIIWCDSTICVVNPPIDLLEYAKEHGVCAFDNLGHPLSHYISDVALEHLFLKETDLPNIPQIMACVILFDFTNPVTDKIFDEWLKLAKDGQSFANLGSKRPDFKSHRHDQAVLSGILWKNQIPLRAYGDLVYQPHDIDGKFGNHFSFVNKGIL